MKCPSVPAAEIKQAPVTSLIEGITAFIENITKKSIISATAYMDLVLHSSLLFHLSAKMN